MNDAKPVASRLDDEEKIRALPWSIVAGMLLSSIFGMWTVFGSIFLLYLQELGISKGQIGLLLSIFPFCGMIAPFVAQRLARLGAKRVCVVTLASRNIVMALLLLLPFVLAAGGHTGAMIFVAGIIFVFALLRALAETAGFPWLQEYVPDSVRGKYGAANIVAGTLASVGAVALAGYVVSRGSGLSRFMWLQGAGCVAGLLGTLCLVRVPGGRPVTPETGHGTYWAEIKEALRDGNFRRYLCGAAGLTVGGGMMSAFMPLLLVERIGIQPGTVIWLDNAVMIGAVASSFLWGWMADRFGSRTALMPGLTLSLALSVFWCAVMATGHGEALSVPALAALGFTGGIAATAIAIGSGRLLLVGVVPPDKSVAYTSVVYAWSGLIGGGTALLAGGILSAAAGLREHVHLSIADPYAVLFILSLLPSVLGWIFFARTRPDGAKRTRDLLWDLAWRVGRFLPDARWR